jgi:hypothetical protein
VAEFAEHYDPGISDCCDETLRIASIDPDRVPFDPAIERIAR